VLSLSVWQIRQILEAERKERIVMPAKPIGNAHTTRVTVATFACIAGGLQALLISMLATAPVQALEFECRLNAERRYIRVEMPGKDHLCEVEVSYQTGEQRVLWYADNESLYCSAKAYELRKKYEDSWDFACNRWPDRDGIDSLSDRQRYILDVQTKSLMTTGESPEAPFTVVGVKAASSAPLNDYPGTLAVQYFLQDSEDESVRDLTQVIIDDGASWKVLTSVGSLLEFIDTGDSSRVETALISAVTDSGAIEVSTEVKASAAGADSRSACYGRQVLYAQDNGDLIARTPHRYVCANQ
jgi:hypothetical protein